MNVTVYCSARDKVREEWKQRAYELGAEIARRGHKLVYGGATGGLMTAVAEGAHTQGGEIIGVIPERIKHARRLSPLLTETVEVPTMSQRKQRMRDLADLILVLPGGYGTMDELFDAVAAGTVGEHHKPLYLLNWDHVYDGLMDVIRKMHEENLIPQEESYKFNVYEASDISGIL